VKGLLKGVKIVRKAAEKGTKGICVMAANVAPLDVISHMVQPPPLGRACVLVICICVCPGVTTEAVGKSDGISDLALTVGACSRPAGVSGEGCL